MQREVNTASHSSFFFFSIPFPVDSQMGMVEFIAKDQKEKRHHLFWEREKKYSCFQKCTLSPWRLQLFFFSPMSLPLSNYISFFFLTQTGEHISCWLFFFLLSSLPFRTPLSHGSKGIINNNKEPPHYLTTSTVSLFFSFPLINRKSSRLLISALGGKKKKEHRQEQQ